MLCIPIRPAFLRLGERPWQSKWKWVHCSGRRICGWKCLETTAADCHDFASLSPDRCLQGPQLKDNPVLLTTLYLLDAVVAHHSSAGEMVSCEHWSWCSLPSPSPNALEESCDGSLLVGLCLSHSTWQQWRMGTSTGLRRLGWNFCSVSCKFVWSCLGRCLMCGSAQLVRRGHYSICVLTSCCSFPEPLLDKRERWKEPAWPNTKAGEFPLKNGSDKKKNSILIQLKWFFKENHSDGENRKKRKTQIVDMIWMFFKKKIWFLKCVNENKICLC